MPETIANRPIACPNLLSSWRAMVKSAMPATKTAALVNMSAPVLSR